MFGKSSSRPPLSDYRIILVERAVQPNVVDPQMKDVWKKLACPSPPWGMQVRQVLSSREKQDRFNIMLFLSLSTPTVLSAQHLPNRYCPRLGSSLNGGCLGLEVVFKGQKLSYSSDERSSTEASGIPPRLPQAYRMSASRQ